MAQKKIFITGATGKIGSFLVKALLNEGHRLTLLSRSGRWASSSGEVKVVTGDLLDSASYISGLQGIDLVVHMAAVTHTNDVDRYYKVNANATRELIKSCEDHGVKRFVFISTRAISDSGGDYSRSKALAEKYLRASALDWVILRPAEVYGVSGSEGVDMLLENIHRFPLIPIIGSGEYSFSPVHISDVIYAITKVIDRDDIKKAVYTIAGPESVTYKELVDLILKKRHLRRAKVHIPIPAVRLFLKLAALLFKNGSLAMDQLPRLTSEKSSDISQAAKDFGFEPGSLSRMAGL